MNDGSKINQNNIKCKRYIKKMNYSHKACEKMQYSPEMTTYYFRICTTLLAEGYIVIVQRFRNLAGKIIIDKYPHTSR